MDERIRWANKVGQGAIRRLYQTDALGLVDEEQIEEVGASLYACCESILLVSRAQARCPRCRRVFQIGFGAPAERPILCPTEGCGWQVTPREWRAS